MNGVLQKKDARSKPIGHEPRGAHASKCTLPSHVDEEIAAEQQINQAEPYSVIAEHNHGGAQKPQRQDKRQEGGILNPVSERV